MSRATAITITLLAMSVLVGCAGSEQFVSEEIRAQLHEGNRLLEEGRVQEAIAVYIQITNSSRHYADAYLNLGQAYEASGEYEHALAAYDRVLELRKADAGAWMRRGSVQLELEEYAEARGSLVRAIELYRGSVPPEAHNSLGLTLMALNKYRSAVEEFLSAIGEEPGNPEAHNNLGIALIRTDQYAEAEQVYKRAIELDPDYIDAHYNLATFYIKYKPDNAKALFHSQRYKELGGGTDFDEWMRKLVGEESPGSD